MYFFWKFQKKYFCFLIIGILFVALSFIILKLYDKEKIEKFSANIIMQKVINYFILALCFIPELIRRKKSNEKINFQLSKINYKIVLVSVLLLLEDINEFIQAKLVKEPISFFDEFNFLFYLTTLLISKFVFKLIYYKHQYISICFIILLEILVTILESIKIESISLILEIIYNFVSPILKGFALGLIKIILDKGDHSVYEICSIIGVFNLIILIIIYFILSKIAAIEQGKYFSVEYEKKFYLDNIFAFFSDYNFSTQIIFFLSVLYFPICFILIIMIIQNYTICHIFLAFQISSFFSIEYTGNIYISYIIIFIFEILATLVFLEIIILNCWGLNKNVKKNIEERAKDDSRDSLNLTDRISERNSNLIELEKTDYVCRLNDMNSDSLVYEEK